MALELPYRTDPAYFAQRADGLLASALDGTEAVIVAFFQARAPMTAEGARTLVAARHGCADWAELEALLAAVPDDDPFVLAYQAIEAGDRPGLAATLDRAPGLVLASGTNDNDLLGLAAATGRIDLVETILARGADIGHANVHGWTALHAAATQDAGGLVDVLLDAGAPTGVSGRGDGGTPLVAALFWGHTDAAGRIAARDLTPGNLRVAAGLGQTERLAGLLGTAAAGAHRVFFRPHGGFPAWTPSPDPREVVDEALAWAARSDRTDALDVLVAAGARIDADVYRGTALAWAAARGHSAATGRLLALGADPSGRSTFGGPGHGEGVTPLHLAAENGALDVIALLLSAGADPDARDAVYDATPTGWAEHRGQTAAAAALPR